jgi:CheY-like chemotaxis protein
VPSVLLTQPVCADAVRYIEALSGYVWFVLALVVFVVLYPTLKGIIRSRAFTIKVGSMELSVQEASEQLQKQVEDLLEQVSDLRLQAGPQQSVDRSKPESSTVLWVDDNPSNNAYETAKLRTDGVQVIEARSTAEAIATLRSGRPAPDVVITDLGRVEDGTFVRDAGLELIKQARAVGFEKPMYMYSTRAAKLEREPDVVAAGGNGITDSPVELLTMFKSAPGASSRFGSQSGASRSKV